MRNDVGGIPGAGGVRQLPGAASPPATPPVLPRSTGVDAGPVGSGVDAGTYLSRVNAARNARRAALPQPSTQGGRLYGGYTEAQLLANPALVQHLGAPALRAWNARAPAPASPGTQPPAPPPTQGPPVGSPPPTPGAPPADAPPPSVPYPGGQQPGGYADLSDPMNVFMSAIPGMRLNAQQQIGDAISSAGFTGNRWGTSAENAAGQIGAQEAMQENGLLQKTLYDYANDQQNRALQATQQGMQLGGQLDSEAQSRLMLPFQVGQYEQGRQDDISKTLFNQWDANKLGWLGPMLQFAGGQGAGSPGSPGQIYTTQQPSKPGAIDWVTALAGLFG